MSSSNMYNEEVIEIQKKEYRLNEEDYYICYVCGRGDNEHVLFLCDECDFYSCHIYCDERLNNVIPEGDWYCGSCCEREEGLYDLMMSGVV